MHAGRVYVFHKPIAVTMYCYPVRMRRGKVSVVSSLSLSWTQKLPNLEMYAPERVVSTMNMSNLARNWLQYVQIRVAWPARVTNRVF